MSSSVIAVSFLHRANHLLETSRQQVLPALVPLIPAQRRGKPQRAHIPSLANTKLLTLQQYQVTPTLSQVISHPRILPINNTPNMQTPPILTSPQDKSHMTQNTIVNTRHMSPQNSTLLHTAFFHHSHTVGIAVEAAALSRLVNLRTNITIITLKAAARNFPSLEANTSSVGEVVPVK